MKWSPWDFDSWHMVGQFGGNVDDTKFVICFIISKATIAHISTLIKILSHQIKTFHVKNVGKPLDFITFKFCDISGSHDMNHLVANYAVYRCYCTLQELFFAAQHSYLFWSDKTWLLQKSPNFWLSTNEGTWLHLSHEIFLLIFHFVLIVAFIWQIARFSSLSVT